MDPRSQVLLRHLPLFSDHLLLVGLAPDELLHQLPNAQGWSWQADVQQSLAPRFPERIHFGIRPPQGDWSSAVVFLPKSRELTDYLLYTLAQQLPHAWLYLVGEKRAGIERAAKQLAAFGTPRKLDSARHCQLWQIRVEPLPETTAPVGQPRRFTLAPQGFPLEILSLPGVFSHGRLDQGTELLLQHLDHLPEGRLLDFGCGAGPVGAALKVNYPHSEVILLDVDAFALESACLTFAANQLAGTFIAGDGIEAAPKGLAAIISNPPFHQGIHTHYQATETLIRQAAHHLQPGGILRIVANSFLRYPELIEQHLGTCHIMDERHGFRIYQAQKS